MNRDILIFFFVLLFLSVTVQASSPFVTSEEGAVGYYYQVTKAENTYTWLIEGKDNIQTVIETEENEDRLQSFRTGVENANSHLFTLWITGVFFIIVSTLTLYLFNKRSHVVKESLLVIIAAFCIPIYILFTASIELSQALNDAEYYFQSLIK
ncbi:hypothetical protein ACJA3J_13525 [Halobacillus sp. SY10]|uniref:hypothetical protein n=1 Tax=Halobacillus sp. SY10 TaxID=3381356 RepID=UPI0038798F6D